MLLRLGRFVVRKRVSVLVVAGLALALAGVFGGGVAEHLSDGGFSDPASESSRGSDLLEERFPLDQPEVVLLVTARTGSVDDPAVARRGLDLTERLAATRGVETAVSYWSLGRPAGLRGASGERALVLAFLEGTDAEQRLEAVERIGERFPADDAVVTVGVGGSWEGFRQVNQTTRRDLARAELVALPVVLVMLVVVFGGLVAAGMPLLVGLAAIVGTFLALRVLTMFTDVSIFALNLTTAMGLGLGIDYSLFMVSRFREELRNGRNPHDAAARTVATAGRTVAFSALAVVASLLALLVFPAFFLRSFAYAGASVVAVAAVGAVVVLPALLAIIGRRIDAFSLRRPRTGRGPDGAGGWHRLALAVMRRPVLLGGAVVALLVVLGAPFAGVRFGLPDDRVLPPSAAVRRVHDAMRADFPSDDTRAIAVVVPGAAASAVSRAELARYASAVSLAKGVARVDGPSGTYAAGALTTAATPFAARFTTGDDAWLAVLQEVEPYSAEGEAAARAVRAVPTSLDRFVTGSSAELVDAKRSLATRLPLAGGLIALSTMVVLFLFCGSLLVPLKAVVLNLLSLTATFGAMVWIFQEGHFGSVLDLTATGSIDANMPVLMFCIAFGLSMDYEVFLLSRIKEEYDRSGDNTSSVALGLERTGGIVTAAAALLAVVFLAMVTSQVSFLKLFGLGLALAVVMDATLVRAVLVPAFMRIAGKANWWAPAPLRALHERIGVSERDPLPEA